MRTTLVILGFALSALAHAADTGDGVAPLSRAFVAWRDAHVAAPQNVMSVQAPSENGSSMRTAYGRRPTGYGLVPSPLDRSGLRKFYRGGRAVRKGRKMASASLLGAPDDALDVAYNVDGKSLTPVKNQGRYGTCWAHATVGCLETDLLRSEGAQYDLSENNMVNLHGFDWPFGGGNGDLATAYLVRWRGPVLEIEDRYPNDGGSPTRLKPFRHVQKVLWIPCRENALDNATIKRAVRDFGAVYVSYYHQGEGTSGGVNPYKDSPYWKASEAAYYMGSYERSNHAVCIVGWDDNYPASRFSTRPAGDGAFLIKNSWGTDWGKSGMEGFEWISYYDATLCGHDETYASVETSYVFTSVEPTDNYDAICGYDELGALGFYGNNSQRGARWGAALFTAETDVNVAAVGIYLPEPYAEYEVYVYGGGNANEPRSGELIGSTVGEAGEYAGFHTIKVACTDKVRRGQRYSVVVKITTDSSYQLAVERPIPGYASDVTAAPGETFFSADGSTWTDFVKVVVGESNCKFSFCCKAYLKNVVDADNSSYAVTFDANGGVGQMPDQTVRYGSPYVLPACTFTRAGYDFQGWTSEQPKATYGAGDEVSFAKGELADDTLSLCAQWSRTVNAVPDPPEITECTDGASTKVTLQWTSVSGAARYKIYCSRNDVFANAVLVDTVVGRTAYEHCCSPGYAFCYWVTAVSADGEESAPGGMRTGYRVPELEVAKSTCSFDRNGGAEEIAVTANSRWRVASSDSWIDVSSAAHEETERALSFSVGANTGRQGRIGRIRLELLCGDADSYAQEIKIVQAGTGNPLPSRPQWKKYVYTSDGVFLEWEPSANAASYALYRKVTYPEAVAPAGEEPLVQGLTDTSYVDKSAALAGAAYTYRVEAVNGTDTSSSEAVTVMGNLWGEAAITWSADVQAFGGDGGTANVTVSLVGAQGFDLMTSAEWLETSVTPTGFRVTAAPNATGGKRYGSVTICCGKMQDFDGTTTYLSKATVPFTQAAGDGGSAEADDAYVATVGAGGGRGSVTVPIPARGKYVFDLSGRPYWVTRVQAPSDITGSSSHVVNWQSTGSMPFTFTCQMNVGGERIWTVPYTADGQPAGCVVVRQKAPDGSAEDRPASEGDPAEVSGNDTMYPTLTFTANGGKGGVRLAMQPAGDKWGYDFADDWYGRPSWVSYVELDGSVVDAGTSGRTEWSSMVKTPEFAFEVAPNDTTSERSYKIAVEHYVSKDSETVDGLIGEITVRQRPGTVARMPPEPVTRLTAQTVSESAVGLQWNASSGAVSYKVLRAPLGKGDVADFETVDDVVMATSYMDDGLPAGSSFYYIVVACNGDGETPSVQVIGRTKAGTPVSPSPSGDGESKPAAPGKPYSNGLGAGSVSLAWDPAEGATTYKVLRAEGEGGAFREIAFDLTSCTYGDNFLVQNEIYRYKIVAVNAWGTTEGEEAMFSTRALRFGPGEASEFMLSATERSTVVGVSSLVWSNFAQREYRGQRNETGGSVGPFYTFDDPRIVDAEKDAVTEDSEDCASDDYWCYQFSFLDALFWGGYLDDFATEDEVADELRTTGDAGGVLEIAFEGADSTCVNYGDFSQDQSGFAAELVREFGHADKLLVMGVTFDESFIWKGTAGVSHAVVCCGYSLDAAKTSVADPTTLKGLFIIDPDNDMFNAGGAGGAPDSITYCPVTWNARRKVYLISNVFGAKGEVDLLGCAYVRARVAVAAENVHKTVNAAVMEEREEESKTSSASVAISDKGWHEVSFPVLPEGGRPEDVFAPVEDKIGYVTYGSLNWNPLTGGTLTALEIGKGYWVQATSENVSWTVTGQGNPDVEIALKAGWNLIGYPLLEEGAIETVLATALAAGNIRYIYSGSRVYPGTLTTMVPGKGYWVYAEAAETIRFDAK